jgi:undecaprenyl-diphosphatase
MKQKDKAVLFFTLIVIFFIIGILIVIKSPTILNFDNSVINYFDNLRFPALDDFMLAITKIGNVYESLLIFIISAIILVVKRKKHSFYLYTLAVALASVSPVILKHLFMRARPTGGLITLTDYSFPSGHATVSIVFLISAILLFAPLIKNAILRWFFATATTILFILVPLSRIFLWVHWPSDVIAGLLLGTACYVLASWFVTKGAKS